MRNDLGPVSTHREAVEEIITLHNGIAGHLRASLQDAIRIGELLVEQKRRLPHGEFTAWIRQHLPFTPRSARNYMMLHEKREQLKTENVSALGEAYRLLRAPQDPPESKDPAVRLRSAMDYWDSLFAESEEFLASADWDDEIKKTSDIKRLKWLFDQFLSWTISIRAANLQMEREAGGVIIQFKEKFGFDISGISVAQLEELVAMADKRIEALELVK